MALADFCLRGQREFIVAYVHHGTETSELGFQLVSDWCSSTKTPMKTYWVTKNKPIDESLEEFWRNERYGFFRSFGLPIFMGHHLDDVIETWIFTSLHGNPQLIPYHNPKSNVFRPFLLNRKKDLVDWCSHNKVNYIEDSSNIDLRFMRNRIRHRIVPEALKVNPGLPKVLKKKVLASV